MIIVLIALGALAILIWAGRQPVRATRAVSMGTGLLSAMAAVGAVVSGLRGAWIVSLGFVALSTYLAQRTRAGIAGASTGQEPAMSRREACAILGVREDATRPEIQAAYRRLIRLAHPDQGGSAGLAAQINAARDCLLKG